jgi:hypothetical protein
VIESLGQELFHEARVQELFNRIATGSEIWKDMGLAGKTAALCALETFPSGRGTSQTLKGVWDKAK